MGPGVQNENEGSESESEASRSTTSNTAHVNIFVYGTLKSGFPNHFLMEDLIRSNDAIPLSSHSSNDIRYQTVQPYPLVLGPLGIPYLLNIPGSGHRVCGELYSVSNPHGLARLDDLEGTSSGHYERLPVKISAVGKHEAEAEAEVVVVETEAYFGHRSYAEEMWRKKCGGVAVGLEEYTAAHAATYVEVKDRPPGITSLDRIRAYVSSTDSST